MNLINDLIEELKISNQYFVPSVIEEFNTLVINKLLNLSLIKICHLNNQ